ncbi:hypothetical protein [Flavobacterium sp.]|uniref:hypothetical protein n=1 Tax=Flavobacterium sp. TaxID=239 RepID=UPI00374D3F7C
MKNLKSLNLGKSLNREEMKSISGGLENMPYCTCGKNPATLTTCGCDSFCNGGCDY